MKATTWLPSNYQLQGSLDLSNNKNAAFGAILTALVLLTASGWLTLRFTNLVHPSALERSGFNDLLILSGDGGGSFTIPTQLALDYLVALVLVLLIHELVHGAFYWWFTRERPALGIKGFGIYIAAPSGFYIPRNQYLVVGIAPLLLLTLVGLIMIVVAPLEIVPVLVLFVTFNAAGSAGDLVMIALLMSSPPDALMQDVGSGVDVYRLERA